jgi:microcystin-dependent protein
MRAHTHTLPVGNTGSTGSSAAIGIMQPALVMNHAIATSGIYLGSDTLPTLGEVRFYAGATPVSGYLPCDGSALLISEHELLHDLLQTQFGGDGDTNFHIPELRGRHGGYASIGSSWGAETLTLSIAQLPAHTHETLCSTPVILTARSVKLHGGLDAWIDMGVSPSIGETETRVGGTTRIEVTFNKAVRPLDGTWNHSSAGAEVNTSAGTITSLQLVSPTLLRILLSGVPNRTCLAVTLHGIACDNFGAPGDVMADRVIRQRVLLGDVSDNGKVTSADIGAIMLYLGLPGYSGLTRHDVNMDGWVNAPDVNVAKGQTNSLVVQCP